MGFLEFSRSIQCPVPVSRPIKILKVRFVRFAIVLGFPSVRLPSKSTLVIGSGTSAVLDLSPCGRSILANIYHIVQKCKNFNAENYLFFSDCWMAKT